MNLRTLLLSALPLAGTLHAATLFEDGFESGLGWTVTTTNQGRAAVSGAHGPAAGAAHLILDDSVDDAINSVAEATFTVDLGHKENVVLNFKAKSLGNEPHAAPAGNFTSTRNYDGVAISVDGGTSWRAVQSLAAVGGAWTDYSLPLDAAVNALDGSAGPGVMIRFSGYDNVAAPLDGIAVDEVSVTADELEEDRSATLELALSVNEGTGPQTGYVLLSSASPEPLVLELTTTPEGLVDAPATVTVPAGATFTPFQYLVPDDNLVTFTRSVTFNLSAPGVTGTPANQAILDNDIPAITLSIPGELTEGAVPAVNNATLSFATAPSVPLSVTLSALPSGEISHPSSLSVPAGQSSVSFTVGAVDDAKLDGNVAVTVKASLGSMTLASATTTALDNETRTLALTGAAAIQEGGSSSYTVSIPGSLPTALTVNLVSSNTAALTVPGSVTIPAGALQAAFTASAPDNALNDGSRTATVTASASSFPDAGRSITITDNEIAAYVFGTVPEIIKSGSALSISLTAVDVGGYPISAPAGTVNLDLISEDGSVQPLTPATASFSGPVLTTVVTLPYASGVPLRLRASDATGNEGFSTPFDVTGGLALTTEDMVWDATRGRFYASVPASAAGPYAGKIVAINPQTLQITGSVDVFQNPGKLALTSGAEILYAELRSNGTIARINPATLTMLSTFPLGTGSPLATADLATIAGQPQLLVVSRKSKGVAVYDNGVMRPTVTPDNIVVDVLEPSADPTVFFGLQAVSASPFHRLKIDAAGVTTLATQYNLFKGTPTEMRTAGDKVFADNGSVVDGAAMSYLGSFGTSGPVCPDPARKRIYFLQRPAGQPAVDVRLESYDPDSFTALRSLTLPATAAGGALAPLLRWGDHGLAYREAGSIQFVNTAAIVPDATEANLAVTLEAGPLPAAIGQPLTLTLRVTNQGPGVARDTRLRATLSEGQAILGTSGGIGNAVISGRTVNWSSGDLVVGGTDVFTISTGVEWAGLLNTKAVTFSGSVDPDFSDNTASLDVAVGYQEMVDVVRTLRIPLEAAVYDPLRQRIWGTVAASSDPSIGNSLIAVDPATGLITDSIPLGGIPDWKSIALSGNGRYIYVNYEDQLAFGRVDLNAAVRTFVPVPVQAGATYVSGITVLEGDGLSVLVSGGIGTGAFARVYDGAVPRPVSITSPSFGMEPIVSFFAMPTPGDYAGFGRSAFTRSMHRLRVDASGVTLPNSFGTGLDYMTEVVSGARNLLLTDHGTLLDMTTFATKANFPIFGTPCVDPVHPKVYLVNGQTLRSYDSATFAPLATLAIPVPLGNFSLNRCFRWGTDGLAIVAEGKLVIVRWSGISGSPADSDGDGIPDSWALANYGSVEIDLDDDGDHDGITAAFEYLFGGSPASFTANPVQMSVSGSAAEKVIRLVFPRRAGVAVQPYGFEVTDDLSDEWQPATGVTETVLSAQSEAGVPMETVEALVPGPAAGRGFVRLKWTEP